MRLSLHDAASVVKLKNKYFGEQSKIYLFGSRVDDQKKGGDIDLYLKKEPSPEDYKNKIAFLVELGNTIGDQKIDLVLSGKKDRLIDRQGQQGVELNLEKLRLQKYFTECDKHLQRIEDAWGDFKEILPLTVIKYQQLNKSQVQAIDQYLYRFTKLQDTLGEKIFRLIVAQYQPDESFTFIDALNLLEKYGYIANVKEWLNLRKVRNEIAHQYDDEPEEMTMALNNIFTQKEIIKEIYQQVKTESKKQLINNI